MGIPVDDTGVAGSLVTGPGQLQFGGMLMGGGTSAGWRELAGWRDHPDADVADSPRPQAHGTYAGAVFGGSLAVTYTYLLRGTPEDKAAYADLIEQHTPMDGVGRALVVDDGTGPWLRMARVIARHVPQDASYRVGPVECSVQFLCADPRRYALTQRTGTARLAVTAAGLTYPLTYPLDYGAPSQAAIIAPNSGSESSPLMVTFTGPLTSPILSCTDWRLGFDIELAAGETLAVDTAAGTALLSGTADRLYTIRPDSTPVERCLIPPGGTTLTLTATSGPGSASVTYRDARM